MGFMALLVLLCVASSPLHTWCSKIVTLEQGSSLFVKEADDVVESENGVFAAGFVPVGDNAYCFAIWFKNPRSNNTVDGTVVWMANPDYPVNGKNSKLSLLKTGNLVLTDAGASTVWETDTASDSSPAHLHLHDTGNLMLTNSAGKVLWQSFDFPTDTLLPGQKLTRFSKLVSSRSSTNQSAGYYHLYFDNDNVLRLLYDGPNVSSIYWPYPWLVNLQAGRDTYNSSRVAIFDVMGRFISSDGFTFATSDYGTVLQRRLQLGYDGNVRVYSREQGQEEWYVSWFVIAERMIHGLCGPNSFWSFDAVHDAKCSCLPGFKVKNNKDWSTGCEPKFNPSCKESESSFLRISHIDFFGYDYGQYSNYTLKECENVCLKLCNCKGFNYAFSWNNGIGVYTCYPKTQLQNGNEHYSEGNFHLKVPKNQTFSFRNELGKTTDDLNCSHVESSPLEREYGEVGDNVILRFLLWFAVGIGGMEIAVILLLWCLFIRSQEKSSEHKYESVTGFRRFSYRELKKATRDFMQVIGKGAGGTVYKGILSDKRIAAIKCLENTNQGEEDFLAEVNIIGRQNHMNLIEMWGYCAEGKHRLLVYEYMEYGSLADNLKSKQLDWCTLYDIALGSARGLAYLHDECLEWILHCDVKPQNILLDSSFKPKIADFGLSKMIRNKDDIDKLRFSKLRGTRGYMAPEWVFNLPITSKVDVYSYGIVVLEMLTGKSPASTIETVVDGGKTYQKGLITWVREKRRNGFAMGSWVEQIVDSHIREYDRSKMKILVEVALECVNEDNTARPTMRQVVEILEKNQLS